MIAHLAGMPFEEVLPAALAGGACLVTVIRMRVWRGPARLSSPGPSVKMRR